MNIQNNEMNGQRQKYTPLLQIKDLNVNFHTRLGLVRALRNLNLSIGEKETLALVGESGCGKSVTAHAINRLIETPPGRIESGSILFRDKDLLQLPDSEMRKIRGSGISMIFQEPMTSLNPVFSVGAQISEPIITHEKISRKKAWNKAVDLLNMVKIPDPGKRAKDYPHQLSGGMRQRVMIAMALTSLRPGLMIADEPTTALDVTIQAQILQLLRDLKERVGTGLLLITHDMGVVAETADRVAVMYAGRKVEEASVYELFAQPRHPYTVSLLGCQCSAPANKNSHRLKSIPGVVPDLLGLGEGCPFANRCERSDELCRTSFPKASMVSQNHEVSCYHPVHDFSRIIK